MHKLPLTCLFIWITAVDTAQSISENIRLNQVGFYPNAPKIAVVAGAVKDTFYIRETSSRNVVYTGVLSAPRTNPFAATTTRLADFSALLGK